MDEWRVCNWPLQLAVNAVLTVGDDEIRRSMRLIIERAKLVVEPSAAVSLAAVFSDQFQTTHKPDHELALAQW